jgi:hypothetical protein
VSARDAIDSPWPAADYGQHTDAQNAACASLTLLGDAQPRRTLQKLRAHLRANAVEPLAAVSSLMQQCRLLCLGEQHDFAGRFLLPELITAAAEGGARWLFLEIYQDQQREVDLFWRSGRRQDLPESAGGGDDEVMRFQQPYVEMLFAARSAGLIPICIDAEGADYDQRNALMAQRIAGCLSSNNHRGVVVAGHLHLAPRRLLGDEDSLVMRLETPGAGLEGSIITVGRAVPDAMPEFSVWADVGNVAQPCLLAVQGSPFASLPAIVGADAMHADDFDYLLFYPASSVLE